MQIFVKKRVHFESCQEFCAQVTARPFCLRLDHEMYKRSLLHFESRQESQLAIFSFKVGVRSIFEAAKVQRFLNVSALMSLLIVSCYPRCVSLVSYQIDAYFITAFFFLPFGDIHKFFADLPSARGFTPQQRQNLHLALLNDFLTLKNSLEPSLPACGRISLG